MPNLTGPRGLVVNTSSNGVTTFGSTVGGVNDLKSLTTNADGIGGVERECDDDW